MNKDEEAGMVQQDETATADSSSSFIPHPSSLLVPVVEMVNDVTETADSSSSFIPHPSSLIPHPSSVPAVETGTDVTERTDAPSSFIPHPSSLFSQVGAQSGDATSMKAVLAIVSSDSSFILHPSSLIPHLSSLSSDDFFSGYQADVARGISVAWSSCRPAWS